MAHFNTSNDKYKGFINPCYESQVNEVAVKKDFQEFADRYRSAIPTDGQPKDGFLYNYHMTRFHKNLKSAADDYIRAVDAWHAVPKVENSNLPDGSISSDT